MGVERWKDGRCKREEGGKGGKWLTNMMQGTGVMIAILLRVY
jgi:hypothetical protein